MYPLELYITYVKKMKNETVILFEAAINSRTEKRNFLFWRNCSLRPGAKQQQIEIKDI